MPNPYILRSVAEAWSPEAGLDKRVLDLSSGYGETSVMLRSQGFSVVATGYHPPPFPDRSICRVGGVDLNEPMPFQSASFDGVNLTEVIEHIEHQAQLVREVGRVLKDGGVFVLSTPNILNVFSRIRFLFTGFLRGRARPVHYRRRMGWAPNIYLIHFYELYFLLSHSGFEIESLGKTKVKSAPVLFGILLYPFMWLFSVAAVVYGEKDPIQRRENWKVLRQLFKPALLFSDNIVVKSRKKLGMASPYQSILKAEKENRDLAYEEVYNRHHEGKRIEGKHVRPPNRRRQKRIAIFKQLVGRGHGKILELGCGLGDLTYALAGNAEKVVGVDVSSKVLEWAKMRRPGQFLDEGERKKVEFLAMSAVTLDLPPDSFDCAVSTSMIEHLHPNDFEHHLKEVRRVLKRGGSYLVWCPNRLGHHRDRPGHLNMLSYGEMVVKMKEAGFGSFKSPLFNGPPLVNAEFKVLLERVLCRLGISMLWSHLGVRNVLVVAKKPLH